MNERKLGMYKSIYISDNPKNKELIRRVSLLEKSYGCSFSELVVAGLRELVKVKKPSRKKPDFRTPSAVKIRN